MRISILLLLASLLVTEAAPLANANTDFAKASALELVPYFDSIEGGWDGTGSVTTWDPNGNTHTTPYDISFRVERVRESSWAILNNVRDIHGRISRSTAYYTVRGDLLIVNTDGLAEPVQILESTPRSLTYRVRRSDWLTGRVFDLTFHAELDATGTRIDGWNTTETNSVVVREETFAARR